MTPTEALKYLYTLAFQYLDDSNDDTTEVNKAYELLKLYHALILMILGGEK